jgi:hypothetical protein
LFEDIGAEVNYWFRNRENAECRESRRKNPATRQRRENLKETVEQVRACSGTLEKAGYRKRRESGNRNCLTTGELTHNWKGEGNKCHAAEKARESEWRTSMRKTEMSIKKAD